MAKVSPTLNTQHILQLHDQYLKDYINKSPLNAALDNDNLTKQINRFKNLYEASVSLTNKKMIKRDAYAKLTLMEQYDYDIPNTQDIDQVVEITISLSDLKLFLRNYENFMEIVDNMDDERVREMLHQLIMFIRLKS